MIKFFLIFLFFGKLVQCTPEHRKIGSGTPIVSPFGRCDVRQAYEMILPCDICSKKANCPRPFRPQRSASARCTFWRRGRMVGGCKKRCVKISVDQKCCPNYWGRDCQVCPQQYGMVCSGHGACSDGMNGTGDCNCDPNITGALCESCVSPEHYGPQCNQVCDCVHGRCSNGVDRDGRCSCYNGYNGTRCDIKLPECTEDYCPIYSRCLIENGELTCKCELGYVRNSSSSQCEEIDSCSSPELNTCDGNATCYRDGPGKYMCKCNDNYDGDGFFCQPHDPCQTNNGNCPNNTVCVFTGPNQSNCECQQGYVKNTYSECELIDLCGTTPEYTCSSDAQCTTIDYTTYIDVQCKCPRKKRLVGKKCYASLLNELPYILKLKGLQSGSYYSYLLRSRGKNLCDFFSTYFIPTEKAVKLSAIGLDFPSIKMVIRANKFQKEILFDFSSQSAMTLVPIIGTNSSVKAFRPLIINNITQPITLRWGDGQRANILSGPHWHTTGVFYVVDYVYYPLSAYLWKEPKHNNMESLLPALPSASIFTRFYHIWKSSSIPKVSSDFWLIPTDEAFASYSDEEIRFLLSIEGRERLFDTMLVHMGNFTNFQVLRVEGLTIHTTKHFLMTYTDEALYCKKSVSASHDELTASIAENGAVQIGPQQAKIVISAIRLRNHKLVFLIDKVLQSPSMDPITKSICLRHVGSVRRRCGDCYRQQGACERNEVDIGFDREQCVFEAGPFSLPVDSQEYGCMHKCSDNTTLEECCPGYFGPDCQRCPGPISSFCYDNGLCQDGKEGSGQCLCRQGFGGVDCSECLNPLKFGSKCHLDCTCQHGICDHHVYSNGTCLLGSCDASYGGENCNFRVSDCDGISCHQYASCMEFNETIRCDCNRGYTGDGVQSCIRRDPCDSLDRGGCDGNAHCVSNANFTINCTCRDGYEGDGFKCYKIHLCNQPERGGCDKHAICVQDNEHVRCECSQGYHGNGYICQQTDRCLIANGGCDVKASCHMDKETSETQCTCLRGFVGDGKDCLGNIVQYILITPSLSRIRSFYNENPLLIDVFSEASYYDSNITAFLPEDDAWNNVSVEDYRFWTKSENLPALMKYHIAKTEIKSAKLGEAYPTFLDKTMLKVYKGDTINKTNLARQYMVNHTALVPAAIGQPTMKIRLPYLKLLNGKAFITNQVLIPPRDALRTYSSIESVIDQTSNDTKLTRFKLFFKILKTRGVLRKLTNFSSFTIFAVPDDEFDPSNIKITTLKYHVVPNQLIRSKDVVSGTHVTTMAGKGYLMGLFKQESTFFANDREITYPDIRTERGIVQGIQYPLLTPIKSRCDQKQSREVSDCQFCARIKKCSRAFGGNGWTFESVRLAKGYQICGGSGPGLRCLAECTYVKYVKKCCPGFYGRECEPCPGGINNVCSNQGVCDDDWKGNGTCTCSGPNFIGKACDECSPGLYGRDCNLTCQCQNSATCLDGRYGTGACICPPAFTGVHCEKPYNPNDECSGTCHTASLCLPHPSKGFACECVSGYTGDGTHCEPIDVCKQPDRGGCHEFATCKYEIAGRGRCTCKSGYEGDGTFCQSINPCLKTNTSLCGAHSSCHHTGPGLYNCVCDEGYSGQSPNCKEVDPCKQANGGCHRFSTCTKTGPGQRKCECPVVFKGDGVECVGTIILVIRSLAVGMNHKTLAMLELIVDFWNVGDNLALFFPQSDKNFSDLYVSNRLSFDQHFVACGGIFDENNRVFPQVRTVAGSILNLTSVNETLWDYSNGFYINNNNNFASYYRNASNGIIFKIPKEFQMLEYLDFKKGIETPDEFIQFLTKLNASKFAEMMRRSENLDLLFDSLNNPFTLLIPTDEAINTMHVNKLNALNNDKQLLNENVRYHIISQSSRHMIQFSRYTKLTTLQGSDVSIGCASNGIPGSIGVNEGEAVIVRYQEINLNQTIPKPGMKPFWLKPYAPHKFSIILLIDKMLEAPSVGGRCDYKIQMNVTEECNDCIEEYPPECDIGEKVAVIPCQGNKSNISQKFFTSHSIKTCSVVCSVQKLIKRCCDDHYGDHCLPCPGGVNNACSNNGVCNSGINGTGQCSCNEGFGGYACEFCKHSRFGPSCEPCQCSIHGTCFDGLNGNGKCFCDEGYIGDDCSVKVAHPATCNNSCTQNSVCDAATEQCICKPGYKFVSYGQCDPINLCLDDNPCSVNAICRQNETEVICKCKSGYIGDGFVCQQLAVGCRRGYPICHNFANCLPQKGSTEYKCVCDAGYEGDGVTSCVSTNTYACKMKCSPYADCVVVGNEANCTCRFGYVGNGRFCIGSISHQILDHPKWISYMDPIYIKQPEILSILQSQQNITIFMPQNNKKISADDIKRHIIPNKVLTISDLQTKDITLTAYNGQKVYVQVATDDSVYVNGVLVDDSDILATNGIIHSLQGVIPLNYDSSKTVVVTTQATTKSIKISDSTTKTSEQSQAISRQTTTTSTSTDDQVNLVSATQSGSASSRVGIALGIFFFIVICVGVVYWRWQRNRNNFQVLQDHSTSAISNPMYDSTPFMEDSTERLRLDEFDGLVRESES